MVAKAEFYRAGGTMAQDNKKQTSIVFRWHPVAIAYVAKTSAQHSTGNLQDWARLDQGTIVDLSFTEGCPQVW